MYVEGGSSPPPRRARKPTPREERMILWLLACLALVLLVAPIGGASLIHTIIAMFGRS